MADYKEMYQILFRSITSAVAIMQKAQQEAEEIYLSTGMPGIRLLDTEYAENPCEDKEVLK